MPAKGETHRDQNHATNDKNGREISALETGVGDAGTRLTKSAMSMGAEVRQGNHNNMELPDAHALLRGFPAYAKDNLVQQNLQARPKITRCRRLFLAATKLVQRTRIRESRVCFFSMATMSHPMK